MNPRVIIITQGLSRIVEPICISHNVVGIIESKSRKKFNMFFRFFRFLYQLLKFKNVTLKSFTSKKNIPYFYMKNGSDSMLEEWVKNLEPDIIVVYSMSQLLKENIFNIPKYKTINLHPSLLPNYRGPNPWFWIYYNMDMKSGVTLHYIDKGEDTGDIIYQKEYDIEPGMKSKEMQDLAIGKIGSSLILKALSNYKKLPRKKQDIVDISYCRARNIKDSEHQSFIKFEEWSVERIWHFLRGTESWLNALDQPKGFYRGQRWIIKEYENSSFNKYKPGGIYKSKNKYFLVCKNGIIHLEIRFSLRNLIFNFLI
jgi:methionyl-tRNA formyltransferase